MIETKQRLGRGLSALLGDDDEDFGRTGGVTAGNTVPVEHLEPGRYQPRRNFDADEMESLVSSIRAKGVLQPILVRAHPEKPGRFEIVAGERRWRAAQLAQLHEVPVVTKELSDKDTLEIALIENLQRENLTPLEEADAYQRLMDEFSHTQEAMAQVIGKSRSHVANMLRLLTLPERVKEMVDSGILTAGHARTLVNVENPEALAQQMAARGLNVRQAEQLAQQAKGGPPKASGRRGYKDADTLASERDLSGLLGLKVNIRFHGKGGSLTINYKTLEQLDDVLHRLSQGSAGREAPLTLVDEVADGIDISALAGDLEDNPETPTT